MVLDISDHYPQADQSLSYREDLKKISAVRIMDEEEKEREKNLGQTASLQQMLSASCMSGLTFDDSWSVDLLVEPSRASRTSSGTAHDVRTAAPTVPLRGRRSSVIRMEEEQNDLAKNRFAEVLRQPPPQPNPCTPPTRRPSSDHSILTSSDSSTATWTTDLTSAYRSFNDSSVITVETELLEQDRNLNQRSCLPPIRTNSRGAKILPTKAPRRLTPTLEVPEEQDPSNGGEDMLDAMPSHHFLPEEDTTATTGQLRGDGRTTNNKEPHKTPRQKFSRDSITLESAVIKAALGNNNWGVKSSLTLDSALFGESALGLVEPDDDDPSSKRTSWAVGSSLTLATFEDSLPLVSKSVPRHDFSYQDQLSQEQQQCHESSSTPDVVTNQQDFLSQEMNRLRFSSHGCDNSSMANGGSDHRTIPSTFSSITPCSKPIRTKSFPKKTAVANNDSPPAAAS